MPIEIKLVPEPEDEIRCTWEEFNEAFKAAVMIKAHQPSAQAYVRTLFRACRAWAICPYCGQDGWEEYHAAKQLRVRCTCGVNLARDLFWGVIW